MLCHAFESQRGLNGRLTQAETVIRSHNDRLKLLEYKSIDIEARSRRNSLLLKGLAEERDENCRRKVLNFLERDLHMEELPTIERVHRLGRYNPSKGQTHNCCVQLLQGYRGNHVTDSFTPGYDL